MQALVLRIDLHLPHSRSLKQRRAALRPIVDGARHRFRVSVAEVDHQERWQRAALGVAVVGGTVRQCEDQADQIERFVWSFPEVEVLEIRRSWHDPDLLADR